MQAGSRADTWRPNWLAAQQAHGGDLPAIDPGIPSRGQLLGTVPSHAGTPLRHPAPQPSFCTHTSGPARLPACTACRVKKKQASKLACPRDPTVALRSWPGREYLTLPCALHSSSSLLGRLRTRRPPPVDIGDSGDRGDPGERGVPGAGETECPGLAAAEEGPAEGAPAPEGDAE
jgi:hypothetical protein